MSKLDELCEGVRSHSLPSLLCALALAGVMLAAIEFSFASGRIWNAPLGWLLSSPKDDWTYALWQVKRTHPRDEVTGHVYLLGGSSSREAVSNNETVSRALSDVSGAPYRFVNLGTRNQTLAETLVLIENLPRASDSVLVFGLQPMFFGDPLSEAVSAYYGVHYPLESTRLDTLLSAELGELPERSQLNIQRYRAWVANYFRTRARNGDFLSELEYENHIYGGYGPLSSPDLRQRLLQISYHMRGYRPNFRLNLELLRASIDLGREKGYTVLLAGLPRNPLADGTVLKEFIQHYTNNINEFAENEEVVFADLHAALDLPHRSFFDHIHLLDNTRSTLERSLIEVVHEQLRRG